MVGGAGLTWLWQRQFGRAVALAGGFATLRWATLHNYVFGHAFVLFTGSISLPQTLLMPPLDYARAALELLTLNFAGDHVKRALAQLARWLSGPQEWLLTVPLHALGVAVLVRVGLFGSRFDPWLRLIALALLLQHGIGVSYIHFVRYNLGTWLLTLLVAAAWPREKGSLCWDRASRMPGSAMPWSSDWPVASTIWLV
jgi:hypothetical protein